MPKCKFRWNRDSAEILSAFEINILDLQTEYYVEISHFRWEFILYVSTWVAAIRGFEAEACYCKWQDVSSISTGGKWNI